MNVSSLKLFGAFFLVAAGLVMGLILSPMIFQPKTENALTAVTATPDASTPEGVVFKSYKIGGTCTASVYRDGSRVYSDKTRGPKAHKESWPATMHGQMTSESFALQLSANTVVGIYEAYEEAGQQTLVRVYFFDAISGEPISPAPSAWMDMDDLNMVACDVDGLLKSAREDAAREAKYGNAS